METYGIEKFGIIGPKAVHRNWTPAQLTEAALRLGEGSLSNTGALVVTTGKYTGRSPKDKFIVDTEGVHDEIAWGKVNRPISREKFNSIKGKIAAYLQNREVFIFDGYFMCPSTSPGNRVIACFTALHKKPPPFEILMFFLHPILALSFFFVNIIKFFLSGPLYPGAGAFRNGLMQFSALFHRYDQLYFYLIRVFRRKRCKAALPQ